VTFSRSSFDSEIASFASFLHPRVVNLGRWDGSASHVLHAESVASSFVDLGLKLALCLARVPTPAMTLLP